LNLALRKPFVSQQDNNPLPALLKMLGKLPGVGTRSARRLALHLLQRKEIVLYPLLDALDNAASQIKECRQCGNLDALDPCSLCTDPKRDDHQICVVATVGDLWALERSHSFRGRYHVLGGLLSALDGVTPEQLRFEPLLERVQKLSATEVILAFNGTVEGQTTAFYTAEKLAPLGIKITRLAFGIPMGGELDYLDEGTVSTALAARQIF
jgi:recombination protein RecR